MGEVRIVSAVVDAKVKGGNELPKPRALVLVQRVGYVWMGVVGLRLVWILISSLAAAFGDFSELDVGAMLFESVYLLIAQAMFAMPFVAMCFGLKRSRYFIPIFCTLATIIACSQTAIPTIFAMLGFVPPVAIWFCSSIRKWYDSLV